MGKIINLLIILFWIAMMSIHVTKQVIPYVQSSRSISLKDIYPNLKPGQTENSQMGIYLGARRIGASYEEAKKLKSGNITISSQTEINIPMLQNQFKDLNSKTNITSKGELIDFNIKLSMMGMIIKIDGNRIGKKLEIVTNINGNITRKKIDYNPKATISSGFSPFLNGTKNLEVGKEWDLVWVNPMTGKINRGTAKILSKRSVKYNKKRVVVYEVELEQDNMTYKAWINKSGEIIRQKLPFLGLTLKKEEVSKKKEKK